MNTLTERMNMQFGVIENAHIIKNVNLSLNSYETLCFICSELDIDLSKITDSDFESASIMLNDFCKAANEDTGDTISVWFD